MSITELAYTYTKQPSGWLVGYLNLYPEQKTQGKDLAELEMMLADLYAIMQDSKTILAELEELEKQEKAREYKGILKIGAEVLT